MCKKTRIHTEVNPKIGFCRRRFRCKFFVFTRALFLNKAARSRIKNLRDLLVKFPTFELTSVYVISLVLLGGFCCYFLFPPSYSFEYLMGEKSSHWRFIRTREDRQLLNFYKRVYEKNQHLLKAATSQSKIPKVIHLIWLGPKPFPESSKKKLLSWRKFHPNWKMKFWTDDATRPCPIEGMEKCLLEDFHFSLLGALMSKTVNYGEQSDLWRYEILFQEGGLYIDHDVECYHSFESLHAGTDFFAVLEKPHVDVGFTTPIVSAICLIASRVGHPILQATVNNVFNCWDLMGEKYADQPIKRVVNRTFKSFGQAVQDRLDLPGNVDLILPASFLFAKEVFSKKQMRILRKKQLIWASHSWDIEWCTPFFSEAEKKRTTKLKALKTRQLEQKRRIDYLSFFCAIVTCINVLLLLYVLNKYRRHAAERQSPN